MERRASAAALVALALAVVLLAGCGPDKPAADAGPTAIKSASIVCDSLPDFALLYVDAAVAACSTSRSVLNAAQEKGTVVYTTQVPPAELLAWYRDQTEVKGLAPGLSSETSYSASDGEKRTVTVTAAADEGGTKVTMNWGRDAGA
jgi:hypothetical protein